MLALTAIIGRAIMQLGTDGNTPKDSDLPGMIHLYQMIEPIALHCIC